MVRGLERGWIRKRLDDYGAPQTLVQPQLGERAGDAINYVLWVYDPEGLERDWHPSYTNPVDMRVPLLKGSRIIVRFDTTETEIVE